MDLSTPYGTQSAKPTLSQLPQSTSLNTSPSSQQMLTPPITPAKPATSPSISRPNSLDLNRDAQPNETKEYEGGFTFMNVIGAGAWSKVFLGQEETMGNTNPYSTDPPTPPISPRTSNDLPRPAKLVAIKAPAQNMAKKVLAREAYTLTHLHSFQGADRHIVPFHGFISDTNSLVLAYLPGDLYTHIQTCDPSLPPPAPVVGYEKFFTLADELFSALAWLHNNGYAHGDIKPQNILLSSSGQPYVADFSSAKPLDSISARDDALTTSYASPELLRGYTKPGGGAPTKEADVWAMGCTLLFVATQEGPYAFASVGGGSGSGRLLAMASAGCIWDAMGSGGWRAMRGGTVRKVLEGALKINVEQRLGAEELRRVVGRVKDES